MRGVFFRLFFFVTLSIWLTLLMPMLLARTIDPVYFNVRRYAWFLFGAMDRIFGIEVEFRGLENIPRDSAYIYTSRHDSTLDALTLWANLPPFTALVKQELFWVPVLGNILRKQRLFSINRSAGTAHEEMPRVVEAVIARKIPLVVFPEGTRARPGRTVKLRSGAYYLQADADIPVITVATNSGYFWPVKGLGLPRGKVVYEIHAPMPRHLDKEAFMAELKRRIVDRSEELRAEAEAETAALAESES